MSVNECMHSDKYFDDGVFYCRNCTSTRIAHPGEKWKSRNRHIGNNYHYYFDNKEGVYVVVHTETGTEVHYKSTKESAIEYIVSLCDCINALCDAGDKREAQ